MPGSTRPTRSFRAALVVAILAVLALLPLAALSNHRAARSLRARVFGGELLDDRNVLFQSNASDDGHVSLMMVLAGRGLSVPRTLQEEASQAQWGLTVAELAERGGAAGLPAKVLHVPAQCIRRALEALPLPVVTMWGTHYVVVESRPEDGAVTFVDPSVGRLRAPIEELERYWRDVVVAFGDDKAATEEVCSR